MEWGTHAGSAITTLSVTSSMTLSQLIAITMSAGYGYDAAKL